VKDLLLVVVSAVVGVAVVVKQHRLASSNNLKSFVDK